jgi:hypothetical protein
VSEMNEYRKARISEILHEALRNYDLSERYRTPYGYVRWGLVEADLHALIVGGETTGLKPCPWCGQPPVYSSNWDFGTVHHVCCENELCRVQPRAIRYKSEEAAIEAWNARAER